MLPTRDKKFIQSHVTERGGTFYTDKPLIIEFPKWYEDKNLYKNENTHHLYGVFALIIGDKYAVSLIPTVLTTSPVMVSEIERGGVVYTQFFYGAQSKVLETNRAIMHGILSYNFFDGYFMQARIPWFIDYEDLCVVMDNTVKYGGTNLGQNHVSNELLTSFVARLSNDKRQFYRTSPKGKPAYVDLMDVRYSSLSTVNKIAGNYLSESLVSALVHKETTPTTLEKHVRN